jgi:hypothetical protein
VSWDLPWFDRYAPEHEARAIRSALGRQGYDGVKFAAHNRAEVDAIAALLTPAERAKVRFSWWSWGEAKGPRPVFGRAEPARGRTRT